MLSGPVYWIAGLLGLFWFCSLSDRAILWFKTAGAQTLPFLEVEFRPQAGFRLATNFLY